jgi:phage baseplate assembly protein gpV
MAERVIIGEQLVVRLSTKESSMRSTVMQAYHSRPSAPSRSSRTPWTSLTDSASGRVSRAQRPSERLRHRRPDYSA